MKRLVIIGAKGLIGRALSTALSSDHDVVGVDLPEVDLLQASSVEALRALLRQGDAVVFTAFVKKQHGDSLENFQKNMTITVNALGALRDAGVSRLVYFSSADVYGEDVHNLAISEATPVCPRSFYGIAKLAAEHVIEKTFRDSDTSTLCLRPPMIFGAHEQERFYGPVGFARAALAGEPITLWGDGSELREFLLVDDVVRAVAELLPRLDVTGALNLACGQSHSFAELLSVLADLLGRPLDVSSRARSKDKVDNAFDNSRFRDVLADFRFTPLRDALEMTLKG